MATHQSKKRGRDEGGTITCHSSPCELVEKLKVGLGDEDLEKFRNSCFGVFLNFPNMKFQSNLAYFLMRRLDPSSQSSNIMKFKFGGADGFFGPDQYIIMTGLSFSHVPSHIPASSSIHEGVFKSKERITLNDIEDAFNAACCLNNNDNGQSRLKLGLLLFMYGALMGKGFSEEPLNLKFMHLVDDVDVFNSYPWGRVSYKYMMREYYECNVRIRRQLLQREKPMVELFGFIFAIQAWAYEVFPRLGERCARTKTRFDDISPRIFRWWVVENYTYEEIEESIQERGDTAMEPMVLRLGEEEVILQARQLYDTDVRLRSSSILQVPAVIPRPQVKRRLSFSLCDSPFEEDGIEEQIKPLQVTPPAYMSRPIEAKGSNTMKEGLKDESILRRLDRLEDLGSNTMKEGLEDESILRRLDRLEELATHPPEHMISLLRNMSHKVNQMWEFIGPMCRRRSAKTTGGDLFSELMGLKTAMEQLRSPDTPNNVIEDGDPSPAKMPSKSTIPTIVNSRGTRTTSDERNEVSDTIQLDLSKHVPVSMYNPIRPYSRKAYKAFKDWYELAALGQNSREFEVPLCTMDLLTFSWLENIYTRTTWLNEENCDVLLNLLRYKAIVRPTMFNERWTTMESLCWHMVKTCTVEKAMPYLSRYVLGELPLQGGLPWYKASSVYGIGYVRDCHWVAYDIDLLIGAIIVYDSFSKKMSWEKLKAEFLNISTLIPMALRHAATRDEKFAKFKNFETFEVVQCQHPNQQNNDHDCGIMAVKTIECLASGFSIFKIVADDCGKYRKYYCAQLYNARKT